MKTLLLKKLEGLKQDSNSNLEFNVLDLFINEVDCYDNLEEQISFINDFLKYGCSGGIIGSLVYCYQTREFFVNNFEDMEEKINEFLEEGIYNPIAEFNSNTIVWDVFYMVANDCLNQLNDDEELQEVLEDNGLELYI